MSGLERFKNAPINIEVLQQQSPWREKIVFFESLGSTNTHALQLGEAGAAEGTIILAEEQTQGRGQFQRPWFSPPGTGIWMSLLLRPKIVPKMIPSLSRFAVIALYDAILKMKLGIHELKIKEPNDLLIDEKKVAGILVETRIGSSSFAVVGIGVNVLQQSRDFPPELQTKVTSLSWATGHKDIHRELLAVELVKALYKRYQELLNNEEALTTSWNLRK